MLRIILQAAIMIEIPIYPGARGDKPVAKKLLVSLLVFMMLGGCAPSVKLADNNRSRLEAVHVDDDVSLKQDIIYMGPGASILGVVGVMSQAKPGEQLRKNAEDHGIRIETLLKQAISDALNASGKTKLCDTADLALAVMKLEVRMYGFSVPNGFSSNLVPLLEVKAELHDPAGQTLWRTVQSLPIMDCPVAPMPAKAIWEDAENIRNAWTGAARFVAKKIVDEL